MPWAVETGASLPISLQCLSGCLSAILFTRVFPTNCIMADSGVDIDLYAEVGDEIDHEVGAQVLKVLFEVTF